MKTNNVEKPSLDEQNKKKTFRRRIIQLIILLILISLGIILSLSVKKIIEKIILQKVELKENSEGYDTWLKPPTTITRDYYLFNITNPKEVVLDPLSTIVNVQETRPYSYLLASTKRDVQWSNDKKSLNYSIHRLFYRHPTKFQNASINDTGYFVDILRAMLRTQFQIRAAQAFFSFGGNELFYHRNALEQLEGFTSPLFHTMKSKMTGPNREKSGFIYRYNGSRSYNYSIRTGLMEKGQVLSFASETVPFSFSSPNPYNITLYDGLTFVPMLFDKPSMNIFQSDFCRPIRAKFNRVVSMFNGIDVHEYVIKLVDFQRCTDINNADTCPEVDLLDISPCISASLPKNTVYLSKVHFYGSSNETMKEMKINGFHPTRDKHEALIYFEPYSGTPLLAHHRVQMNIDAFVDPMEYSEFTSNFEATGRRAIKRVIPLLWIDQEVTIDEETLSQLRMVHRVLRYGPWIFVIGLIVLPLIICGLLEYFLTKAAKNQRTNRTGLEKTEKLIEMDSRKQKN